MTYKPNDEDIKLARTIVRSISILPKKEQEEIDIPYVGELICDYRIEAFQKGLKNELLK